MNVFYRSLTPFLLLLTTTVFASEPKSLDAPFLDTAPVLDGQKDDLWNGVPETTDFVYPWQAETPEKTSLRVFHNKTHLYLFWDVVDSTPVFVEQREEMDIAAEDRVEVYFEDEPNMANYYSMETSPTGRALDYHCKFHRRFDFSWQFPNVQLAGEKQDGGYTVEVAFPLATLRELGVLKDDQTIHAGFFRADFKRNARGDVLERWISWINPNKPEEDFHVPETLGLLRLLER